MQIHDDIYASYTQFKWFLIILQMKSKSPYVDSILKPCVPKN